MTEESLEQRGFGDCCGCGKVRDDVRNIIMLNREAPVPGTGWGCVVCGVPPNGAFAVLCDECCDLWQQSDPADHPDPIIRLVCVGFASDNKRVPIGTCTKPFGHDMSKHEGENEDADRN